jgi:large subunit ribosomal protein L18
MSRVDTRQNGRIARHKRLRKTLWGVPEKPRLSVFRSLQHIYAQIIDDSSGHTMVAASSLKTSGSSKMDAARHVGEEIAQLTKAAGLTSVVFDRGGNKYHGRVKALAEAAREGGLKF